MLPTTSLTDLLVVIVALQTLHYFFGGKCSLAQLVRRQELATAATRMAIGTRHDASLAGRIHHGVIDQILVDDEQAPRNQRHTASDPVDIPDVLDQVDALLPDLTKFDRLLTSGEPDSCLKPGQALEDQPQAVAAAHHQRRVPGAGPGSGGRQRRVRTVRAPPHRAGGGRPPDQRDQGAHQASELPGAQGLRHVRLQRHAQSSTGRRSSSWGSRKNAKKRTGRRKA